MDKEYLIKEAISLGLPLLKSLSVDGELVFSDRPKMSPKELDILLEFVQRNYLGEVYRASNTIRVRLSL